jgi:hypothetical protein
VSPASFVLGPYIDQQIGSKKFYDHANELDQKGKTSLGDAIYRSITEDTFDPVEFLEGMDLSTEHKVLDLKNRIEASTVIWKRKMQTNKDSGKSSWSSIISFEKREQFEDRAETILHLLKLQFPGTPQSQLDISKIQYNRVYICSIVAVVRTLLHGHALLLT